MGKKIFKEDAGVSITGDKKEPEFGIKLREDEFEEDNFEEDNFEEDGADMYLTSAQRKKISGTKAKKRKKHNIGGHSFADVGQDW